MSKEWIEVRLPTGRQLGRFILWSMGRVTFSGVLFCLDGSRHVLEMGVTLVKWSKVATLNLVRLYDQLPYAGTHGQNVVDTSAIAVLEPSEIVTNLVQLLEGKHCLIIGDTGTGKSTLAQWLAYQVGGTVTVYDPDAAPDEWQGLNVIGRCGDFAAIESAMANDMEDLQSRVEVRGTEGDKALSGKEIVMIAEEFPLLASQVPNSVEWLLCHARRGRKPKKFIVALSQDDSVKALGIEGEGGVRNNFRKVRLGKYAVNHAKSLKDTSLASWLKSGNYRCMVDDYACQLPDLSQFKAVTQQLSQTVFAPQVVIPEPTVQQDVRLTPTVEIWDRNSLSKAVKACLEGGLSESKVIKDVLGYQGARYQEGKAILEKLKNEAN